jgi:hypothetical protein
VSENAELVKRHAELTTARAEALAAAQQIAEQAQALRLAIGRA